MAAPPPPPGFDLNLVSIGPGRATCRVAPRELRFEWLQAGDEPSLPGAGTAPVCLAVYEVDPEHSP